MKWWLIITLALGGCLSDETFSEDPLIAARPYLSARPNDYNEGTSYPLIITLHGSGSDGYDQGTVSGLQEQVTPRQFILVAPDGEELAPDFLGWNITCCEGEVKTDDVEYLRAVIADVSNKYNVDSDRIYFTGFSNGGFMAYLMACEASDLIAAVAVHAGTHVTENISACTPSEKVPVMHTHGTVDEDVNPEGGTLEDFGIGDINFVSTQETLDHWRGVNECTDQTTTETVDGDQDVTGEETTIHRYADCSSGADMEFWEMAGSEHFVSYSETYVDRQLDFLFSHSK